MHLKLRHLYGIGRSYRREWLFPLWFGVRWFKDQRILINLQEGPNFHPPLGDIVAQHYLSIGKGNRLSLIIRPTGGMDDGPVQGSHQSLLKSLCFTDNSRSGD